MANRTPGEQAVIQGLQAVANYPESKNFVETMLRSLPGLQTLPPYYPSSEDVAGSLVTRDPNQIWQITHGYQNGNSKIASVFLFQVRTTRI